MFRAIFARILSWFRIVSPAPEYDGTPRPSEPLPYHYTLTCSSCQARSPGVPDEDDVVDEAIDAGWQAEGHNEDDRDLCPSCQRRSGEAGAESWVKTEWAQRWARETEEVAAKQRSEASRPGYATEESLSAEFDAIKDHDFDPTPRSVEAKPRSTYTWKHRCHCKSAQWPHERGIEGCLYPENT